MDNIEKRGPTCTIGEQRRRIRRTHKTSADFLRWLRGQDTLTKQATEENTERVLPPAK